MSTPPRARILEVTSYPPPRAGWGVRVEFVKHELERQGHLCTVLNIGESRLIPSTEYETCGGGGDFVKKVLRFSRQGFVVHAHANGDAIKGIVLALIAELINLGFGRRCYLTFHAGAIQRYFPLTRNWTLAPLFWLLFAIPRRIVCNSEIVKRCIMEYGVPAEKIVPIPAFSRQYLEYTPVALPGDLEALLRRLPTVVFTYVRMRPLFFPTTLIEGMAQVMRRNPGVGLAVVGGSSHADEGVAPAFHAAIAASGVSDRICLVDDLDHDAFLTVLTRSALYLRTPITDGVASSVLEALALGVPVVGSENNARPDGVMTYPADDAARLAAAVEDVIARRAEIAAALSRLPVRDTVADEAALLAGH